MACIAGGIAEAYFGAVPEDIRVRTLGLLDERLRAIVEEFPRAVRRAPHRHMTF
jgi:hypothetical protein